MQKAAFWRKDWFLGLAVTLAFAVAGSSDLIRSLERKAYDLGVRATDRTPSDRIAVIAIDDASIQNIGRWPWPRDVHARLTEQLAGAAAKAIGSVVFLTEPQRDPGLVYVNSLLAEYQRAVPNRGGLDLGAPLARIGAILAEAEQALNTDRKLARSYQRAGNVLLPMLFELGDPRGRSERDLPDYVTRNAIANVDGASPEPPFTTTARVIFPIAEIGRHAAGIGHLNARLDVDGGIRGEPLVLAHFDQIYPSLALLVAARSLNLDVADVRVELGRGVSLANLRIATDAKLQMHTYFYKDRGGRPAFPVDSFFDVFTGRIPVDKYRDKIVLIGPTAAGVGTASVTPVSPAMAPVLTLAHTVSSILQEHFFIVPSWAPWAETGVFLAIGLYLIVLLPRIGAGMAFIATAVLFVALVGAHFGLMTGRGMWLQLMLPATLLLVGYLLLTTKRFLVTEAGKLKSDAESAESNRMLGLAFQGQGQLEMAFDKFRKVKPVDEAVLDNLYNLALDFERKRQFNKAEAVYRYVAEHNPKFRDVGEKVSRAKQLSETVILGGAATGARTNQSIMTAGTVEKPMLGRYQVEKELGKGAMGVVYQGRDPKIGRVVAIKTMALAQEFEPDELADVRERFFREAETAGRLNHPNIVTIFDAGEEHDLAYIAMEFLKGQDLTPYTKAGKLQPAERVISIVARVADALGYAHRQGIVHRDIKPANIMYEPDSDTVKVTDFGIARITDSSKTRTGMVLGTPSYMSPEQLAGRRIDGRSDLFSLAVSLYQLLSGRLPFEGESMAQLMFKIANAPAPSILSFNPGLPPAIAQFLERAMAKDAEARYQTGEEFAAALRACAAPAPDPGIRSVDISL
ncbi:MAG: serine/threonine-protein kinase [Burkholderiales bacterium]|nr:serine/threonine-protein kinase [Burkholderiales bacterium]